jgi:phosphopantetheinyl transferase
LAYFEIFSITLEKYVLANHVCKSQLLLLFEVKTSFSLSHSEDVFILFLAFSMRYVGIDSLKVCPGEIFLSTGYHPEFTSS